MQAEKSKKVSVTVNADTYKKIEELAGREIRTVSGLCRHIIKQYFKNLST